MNNKLCDGRSSVVRSTHHLSSLIFISRKLKHARHHGKKRPLCTSHSIYLYRVVRYDYDYLDTKYARSNSRQRTIIHTMQKSSSPCGTGVGAKLRVEREKDIDLVRCCVVLRLCTGEMAVTISILVTFIMIYPTGLVSSVENRFRKF